MNVPRTEEEFRIVERIQQTKWEAEQKRWERERTSIVLFWLMIITLSAFLVRLMAVTF